MTKETNSTTEVNQKVIIALSGLTAERLKDYAVKIQLDLETLDLEDGVDPETLSPEEFFEEFAASNKWRCDFSSDPDYPLADLDTPNIYLAAAWNFNDFAKYFLSMGWPTQGWSEQKAGAHASSYLKAVDYLIKRALAIRHAHGATGSN